MLKLDAVVTMPPPNDPVSGYRVKRTSFDHESHIAFIEVLRVRQSGAVEAIDPDAISQPDEYQSFITELAANPSGRTVIEWLIEHRTAKYGDAAPTPLPAV